MFSRSFLPIAKHLDKQSTPEVIILVFFNHFPRSSSKFACFSLILSRYRQWLPIYSLRFNISLLKDLYSHWTKIGNYTCEHNNNNNAWQTNNEKLGSRQLNTYSICHCAYIKRNAGRVKVGICSKRLTKGMFGMWMSCYMVCWLKLRKLFPLLRPTNMHRHPIHKHNRTF